MFSSFNDTTKRIKVGAFHSHSYAIVDNLSPRKETMTSSGRSRVPIKKKKKTKKTRVDITHTCLAANPTALVGVCDCASATERISCEKWGPTSDVRSEFVVVAVQQAVQDVRDVTLVHFGSQHPRLVGHLVVIVRLEGAAGRRDRERERWKRWVEEVVSCQRKVGKRLLGAVLFPWRNSMQPSLHPSMQYLGPTHVIKFAEQPDEFWSDFEEF